MKKLLLVAFALCAASAFAQTNVSGDATVKAGLGAEDPIAAKVNLKLSTPKFTFAPYVGITAIGKDASAYTDDVEYIYARTGNVYSSTKQMSSKGTDIVYGVLAQYVSGLNTFAVNYSGQNRNEDVSGMQKEFLRTSDGKLLSSVARRISKPGFAGNNHAVKASFRHKTQRIGESFGVQYQFSRKATDELLCSEYTETVAFDDYKKNELQRKNTTTEHNVTLDWSRPLSALHSIDLGASYLYRLNESNVMQKFDAQLMLDENFQHSMHSVDVFAGYHLRWNPLVVNARIAYEHTRMESNNLDDVIPQINAQLNLNKRNMLSASYAMRIVRPSVELLAPYHVKDAYTEDFGNANLTGTHVNNVTLQYTNRTDRLTFGAAVAHIFVEDGFNAIWMEKDNIRVSTWGNEGARRAWSIAPSVNWMATPLTKLAASATLLWDKRIAYAINMEKEHWGITTDVSLSQVLPLGINMQLFCKYSEGNTVDLYSHSGRMLNYGASLRRAFLPKDRLVCELACSHLKSPEIILTQGAYSGTVLHQPDRGTRASLSLTYKW